MTAEHYTPAAGLFDAWADDVLHGKPPELWTPGAGFHSVELGPGLVVLVGGAPGAGKTALTRGLARGWGALERVTSPTFTLINEYRRARDSERFYHVDAYRLSGAEEAVTTGLEDILDAPGVVVIEWPERIEPLLPAGRLWIDITAGGESERTFTLRPGGERAAQLVRELRD